MTFQLQQKSGGDSKGRVTISDMSEALGLTKSTVSRALNDYPDISDSTRTRVRRMAEKMGYRPLSYAQAIRTGLSKSLGLVIQLADHDAQRPFLAEFLSGLSQGASAKGWTLTIAAADGPEAAAETFRSMIRDRKVDGFVLPRTLIDDPRITLLKSAQVPFVLFGRTPDCDGCAWHDVRGEDAIRDAVRHLVDLGHRSIGFINGGMCYNYAPLRLDGYLSGLAEAGLSLNPAHIRSNAMTIEEGAVAARAILSDPAPPTALICAVDMAALGVYRAASRLGLRIGTDLSVIAYDGIPDGAHLSPPLSTFAVDYTEVGHRLSDLLIQRIKGADASTLRETVQATFLNRGSTGAPRKTQSELACLVRQAV